MKCSDCSREITPVVAIDVDGTMGDYHGHFLRFAYSWLGGDLSSDAPGYSGAISFSDYCREIFGIDLATYRQIKLAYRQGGMKRTMPIFDGARALCWAVKDAGAELWITTTRPYLALDNIVPDTVEWLRRHEIAYDGILFDEDKYEELAKRVDSRRVVAVLDDLPEMYDAAAKVLYFGHDVPLLIKGGFNYGVKRTMMATLDAATDIVLDRIKVWKEQYA